MLRNWLFGRFKTDHGLQATYTDPITKPSWLNQPDARVRLPIYSPSVDVLMRDLVGQIAIEQTRWRVEWWPKGNKTNSVRKGWPSFVKILEQQMRRP